MIAPEWFYLAVLGVVSLAFGIGVCLGRSIERQTTENKNQNDVEAALRVRINELKEALKIASKYINPYDSCVECKEEYCVKYCDDFLAIDKDAEKIKHVIRKAEETQKADGGK